MHSTEFNELPSKFLWQENVALVATTNLNEATAENNDEVPVAACGDRLWRLRLWQRPTVSIHPTIASAQTLPRHSISFWLRRCCSFCPLLPECRCLHPGHNQDRPIKQDMATNRSVERLTCKSLREDRHQQEEIPDGGCGP